MLVQVAINYFRCFQALDVALQPLTILVGPNDSGKSAFLSALRYLVTGSTLQATDTWRENPNVQVVIKGATSVTEVYPNDHVRNIPSLLPLQMVQLPSKGAPMQGEGYPDDQGAQMLEEDGSGVPALMDYLLRRDRKRFFAAVKTMQRLIPGLEEVEVATPSPQKRRLDLVVENGYRLPADRTSAGVRLLLFFVSLAYHPSPPKLILLEEPEIGIHPKRLVDVMNLLRQVTQGTHGGPAQVILTTHSPYLLDLVDLGTDQVLVFRRDEDGSRIAEPADTARLKDFLAEFMLGEVWYNQGEEGLVAHRS